MNIPDKAIRAAHDAAGAHYLTLDDMERALEAAAPYIAAQALRDAAEAQGTIFPAGERMLRRRADELEADK